MVLCDYEKDANAKDRYTGIPSLVVEILSPTNRSNGRVRKLGLYRESGIQEWGILTIKPIRTPYILSLIKEMQDEVIYNADDGYAHFICLEGLKAQVPRPCYLVCMQILCSINWVVASGIPYCFASLGQVDKADCVCSMISVIRAFASLASLPSLMRCSTPGFLSPWYFVRHQDQRKT